MSRRARNFSLSGYTHIIVRGIGKQILFEESMDYKRYLKKLEQYCIETDARICAYCLMENHVHLLVRSNQDNLVLLMKKTGVSYSAYFNRKYGRNGHLFQDRYLSEPIEDERYFVSVLRYILQNPQKAGICDTADYKWSSFGLYKNPPVFMDLFVIKALFQSSEQYEAYVTQKTDEECLDVSYSNHNDEWAKMELQKTLNIQSGTVLQGYDKAKRNSALVKLKERGLTNRQIERLTGISRNIVQRAR